MAGDLSLVAAQEGGGVGGCTVPGWESTASRTRAAAPSPCRLPQRLHNLSLLPHSTDTRTRGRHSWSRLERVWKHGSSEGYGRWAHAQSLRAGIRLPQLTCGALAEEGLHAQVVRQQVLCGAPHEPQGPPQWSPATLLTRGDTPSCWCGRALGPLQSVQALPVTTNHEKETTATLSSEPASAPAPTHTPAAGWPCAGAPPECPSSPVTTKQPPQQ